MSSTPLTSIVPEAGVRIAASADKSVVFLEGAVHGFTPCKDCAIARGLPEDAYGETIKTLYDTIDIWLSKPGRF